jgi:hypothetical protein
MLSETIHQYSTKRKKERKRWNNGGETMEMRGRRRRINQGHEEQRQATCCPSFLAVTDVSSASFRGVCIHAWNR